MQIVRPPYLMRGGSYGSSPAFGAVGASLSGSDITITATTSSSLVAGRFGAAISVNGAAAQWYDGVGAASSQSLTLSLTDIGAVAGDLICIDIGYSLTNPATTKVYASASGKYITPSVGTITISDTTPTVGDTLTGTNGTALAPGTVAAGVMTGATRSVVWVLNTTESSDVDNSYSVVSGDVGKTITFRNKIVFGSTTNFDSAATSAVVAAGIAYVQGIGKINGNGSVRASAALTFDSATTAGNAVFVAIGIDNAAGHTVTDNVGNTYTAIVSKVVGNDTVKIYKAVASTTATLTVTLTNTGGNKYCAISIVEFSGVSATAAITSTSSGTFSTPVETGAITSVTDGSLYLAAEADGQNRTATADSPFTLIGSDGAGESLQFSYYIKPSAGSQNAVFTLSGIAVWVTAGAVVAP